MQNNMWETQDKEVTVELEEWNKKKLKKMKEGFKVQMDWAKAAELNLKIKTEKEKPLIELKSFLIKLEDDDKIKRIEEKVNITEKISYIESLLEKENSEEQTEKLEYVLKLLENIKYNKSI